MKLSETTRINLAARKEQRDTQAMEAAGYYSHGVTLADDEKIADAVISKDGKSIWIKTTEARSA